MAAYHWCARCGWRDETQMFDVRTCYCGSPVNVEAPDEPFEAFLARDREWQAIKDGPFGPSILTRVRRWLAR